MYWSQHELLELVGLGLLDMLRRGREKKGGDALRLFGLRESWRKKKIRLSKVKAGELPLLWFDVKSVKGRKEGKDEEIKEEAIRPVKMGKKKWSPIESED